VSSIATLPAIGPTAAHSVYVEDREGRLLDDAAVIVPVHPTTAPGLPRADRREPRAASSDGWLLLAIVVNAICALIGLGWIGMQALMAIKAVL
jgi:hypothetical protein